MKGLQLIKVGFDSLENHSPEYEEVIKVFVPDEKFVAHKKCGDYLNTLNIKPYLGYNGEVYPQFKTKEIEII